MLTITPTSPFVCACLLGVEPGKMAQKEGGSKDSGETGRWEGRRGGGWLLVRCDDGS